MTHSTKASRLPGDDDTDEKLEGPRK